MGIRRSLFGSIDGLLYGLYNGRSGAAWSDGGFGLAGDAYGALFIALLLLRLQVGLDCEAQVLLRLAVVGGQRAVGADRARVRQRCLA